MLRDVPAGRRSARFYAVIVLLRHAEDPQPLIADGCWEGEIAFEPCGSGGFGYNPIFFDPLYGMTAAQMGAELKIRSATVPVRWSGCVTACIHSWLDPCHTPERRY